MLELGLRADLDGAEELIPLSDDEMRAHFSDEGHGHPTSIVGYDDNGEHLIFGFDDGTGEQLVHVETFADMALLYERHTQLGHQLRWYVGDHPTIETITETGGMPTA